MIDSVVINLANFQNDKNGKMAYRHVFRFPDRARFDIAIARIDSIWPMLTEKKNKKAIELNPWPTVTLPEEIGYLAAGYFNEHKFTIEKKLAVQLALVFAEAASNMSAQSPTFSLHSTLKQPHGYYFSGMSGGPIFLPQEADKLLPVGIVIEGGAKQRQKSTAIIYQWRGNHFHSWSNPYSGVLCGMAFADRL